MSASENRTTARRWLIATSGLALLGTGIGIGRFGWSSPPVSVSAPMTSVAPEPDDPNMARITSLLPDRNEMESLVQMESAGAKESNSGGIAGALRIPIASLREAALLQEGYVMRKGDPASALRQLGLIEDRDDRDAFVRGVFAHATESEPLSKVLNMARGLEGPDRRAALFATLESLTGGGQETLERAGGFAERFGIEAGVGMALSLDPAYRPDHGKAWIEVFGDTDGKGAMIGSFAAVRVMEDREGALALGDQLAGWDREVFLRTISGHWTGQEPAKAWDWARQGALDSEPGGAAVVGNVLRNWARNDFAAADRAFQQLTDPDQRRIAAHGMAESLAWNSGTAVAVNWANQLPTDAEKDAAHAAIAIHSPQGIGVALDLKDGFAVINKVIPDGAAARDGQLQQGDRIVEVDPGTGKFQNIYGRDLNQALTLIRGDSGSGLRLRVIRQDKNGNFRDRVVELTREQIVLEGS